MKISYMNLFSQALKHTWSNKSLWIFGIFAALFNTIYFVSFINPQDTLLQLNKAWFFFTTDLPLFISVVMKLGPLAVTLTIILVLALLSIGLGFLWLNLVSQAAIITNTSLLENKKSIIPFKENFRIERKTIWKILGLLVATNFVILVLTVTMSLPKLAATWFSISGSSVTANVIVSIIGIIFFGLGIFVFFSALYALNYIVLKKLSVKESVEKAVHLFSKNWLISLEVVVIIVTLSILITYSSFYIGVVYTMTTTILKQLVTTAIGGFLVTLSELIAQIVLVLFVGFVTAFQYTLWTTLFERVNKKDYKGFIQNLFNKNV